MATQSKQVVGVSTAAGSIEGARGQRSHPGDGDGWSLTLGLVSAGWQRLGLVSVLAVSAFVNLWRLDQNGFGNSYYAAAVRSMMQSWHNFFYASFDPGGYITVDKPPVALWIQTAFAKVLGFSGFSIHLAQALAGVGAVWLLYLSVSRVFGRTAGLIAGLALALTPITVAINRSNNLDAWLVFFATAAAYAVVRALENGSLRWLVLSAVLVGVAFNTKTLAGLVMLPALWAAYLVVAPVSLKRRVRDLVAATVVLAVVSGAWVAAVDLTPAEDRPYVGGSQTNSELNLLLEYNGLGRIDGQGGPGGDANRSGPPTDAQTLPGGQAGADGALQPPAGAQPPYGNFVARDGAAGAFTDTPANGDAGDGPMIARDGGGPGGAGFGGGQPGLLRLFNADLAAQASWLIPLGLIGGAGALLGLDRRLFGNQPLGSMIVWGGWLLTAGAVFSKAEGIFHPYYLSFIGPAVGGMAGIGMASFRTNLREQRRWLNLVAPAALLATAGVELMILRRTPSYEPWIVPVVAITVGIAFLVLASVSFRRLHAAIPHVALGAAFAALLLPPLVWTSSVLANPGNSNLPYVSPATGAGGNRGGLATGQTNSGLTDYLMANRGSSKFIVATDSSMSASPLIIATGEPVMAIGGFSGGDPSLTLAEFAQMVEDGTVRFYLAGGGPGGAAVVRPDGQALQGGQASPQQDGAIGARSIGQIVVLVCPLVDSSLYGGSGGQLYDCSGMAGAIRSAAGGELK